MNASEFARHLGVSPQAVSKALHAGQLDGATQWEVHGKRKEAVITNLPLAVQLWLSRPGARAPALERARATVAPADASSHVASSDPLSDLALSRLELEKYKAKNERLEFEQKSGRLISVERAKEIYGRQIAEAKNAVMALGKHARSRIPHLTVDDVVTIEELARTALEGVDVEEIDGGAA